MILVRHGRTEVNAGAPGHAVGRTPTAVDAAPVSWLFTARRRTWYVVPLASPGMVTGLLVAAGLSAVHAPPSSEYS